MFRCLAALLSLCFTFQADADDTLIRNVTLVPMDREHTVPAQSVLVRNGMIVEIRPAGSMAAPEGTTIIDGTGRWLLPGLAEMHAHVPPVADEMSLQRTLELFLSQGVTTLRGVLGEPGHLPLRAALANGERVGPRLFTAGPSLNGRSVEGPEQARTMVEVQKAAGYDLLKLHSGLSLASFDAILTSAHAQRMPVAGHVSADVGLLHTLQQGQHSIEHLDDYLRSLIPEGDEARSADPGFFGLSTAMAADAGRIPLLVAATRKSGAAVSPTETLMVNMLGAASLEQLQARPENAYVPTSMRKQWAVSYRRLRDPDSFDAVAARRMLDLRRELLKALHDGGVPVLLGSDAPQVFNVPGFSAHRELALMVAAGLSPFEALRSGTVTSAEHLGQAQTLGRIAPGFHADLILLSANPLTDIRHAQLIEGVMAGGRWHDRADLDARLARIRSTVAE